VIRSDIVCLLMAKKCGGHGLFARTAKTKQTTD
jgi:hypothetical protein